MPSPVCLTSHPRWSRSALRVSALWIWSKWSALVSPKSLVMRVESFKSVNMMARKAASMRDSTPLPGEVSTGVGSVTRPRKASTIGIHFNDFVRHQSMGFIMRLLDGFFVRRHDQAKGCTAWLIKPVGQKLDFIFLLNRQIQLVSMGDGASRRSFDVVTIHIQRHFLRLLSSVRPAGCSTRHAVRADTRRRRFSRSVR